MNTIYFGGIEERHGTERSSRPDPIEVEQIARELAGEGFDSCDPIAVRWMDCSADDDVASFRRAAHRYFGGVSMDVAAIDAERAFARLRERFIEQQCTEYVGPATDRYYERAA